MIHGLSPLDEIDAVVRAVTLPVQAVGGLSIRQAIECAARRRAAGRARCAARDRRRGVPSGGLESDSPCSRGSADDVHAVDFHPSARATRAGDPGLLP